MSAGDGDPGGVEDDARRHVSDPRVLRALAHPLRIALLELLIESGPLTATEAGARLGETPANASFHLRTLARYGFVEEAPGGRGRQRPWQAAVSGVEVESPDDDTEANAATSELATIVVLREVERLRGWLARRSAEPPEWRRAPFLIGSQLLYLTAKELDAVGKAVEATTDQYRGRAAHPERRPPGARPVSFVALAVPRGFGPGDEPPQPAPQPPQ